MFFQQQKSNVKLASERYQQRGFLRKHDILCCCCLVPLLVLPKPRAAHDLPSHENGGHPLEPVGSERHINVDKRATEIIKNDTDKKAETTEYHYRKRRERSTSKAHQKKKWLNRKKKKKSK